MKIFNKKCFLETKGNNFWEKVAHFGVKDEMPIYIQKSTLFFNITMRITFIAFLSLALSLYLAINQIYAPIGFLIALIAIIFTLLLNMNGKVQIGVFITAVFFPIYFIFLSVLAKTHGEGNSLVFYIVPRFGIIIMSIISFAVLGFKEKGKGLIGISVGFLSLILFNPIHEFFGIYLNKLPVDANIGNFIIFALSGIFIFILIIVGILQKINNEYESLVTNQRNELIDRNTEIKAQTEEIVVQKEYIEKQNTQITESIRYAARIQEAVLTTSQKHKSSIQHFIVYKPRDVVSGDFYKIIKVSNTNYLFIAADCTGHGVPGAFVSMLGISFLSEITKITHQPAEILNALREKIKLSLNQTGKTDEAKDGMDMAVCLLDVETKKVKFAGAHSPLLIVHANSEITQLKPDRMPVGVYLKEKDFSYKEYQLQVGDMLYMFSDGFIDQFGGAEGGKYKMKRFRLLLQKTHLEALSVQQKKIEEEFTKWTQNHPQLDDVLVMGISINN